VLTRRGISSLFLSLSLTAVGWALIIRELMVVGVAVGLVSLLAFVSVWVPFGRDMQFSRSFVTRGVHSGDLLRVDLTAQGGWTPTLSVQERLPGGRSVTATLAGKGRNLTFETPALHRGLNVIGPTIGRRTDFFGLFQRTSSRSAASQLIVWPARVGVDQNAVRKLLVDPNQQPRIGVLKPGRPVAAFEGDLRAYVPGDEPRRIHWPSSARTGNLVVRTDASVVSDNRYVLTIDLDTDHHNLESFELLLSVATSFVLALLPVPVASLHREDSFGDDLVVEVLEGELSLTPGKHRFRYPELLLDHLALATFTASNRRGAASPPRASTVKARTVKAGAIRGGLLLGGPLTNFSGAGVGIQCGARTNKQQEIPADRTTDGKQRPIPRGNQSLLALDELYDLPQVLNDASKAPRASGSSASPTPIIGGAR
jgi:Protein of unknown function DUF58